MISPLFKRSAAVAAVVFLAGLFYFFDPVVPGLFPSCPFRSATGLLCPGCGSQRALHALLHLRIGDAFSLNPLMVLSIPYLLAGFAFEQTALSHYYPKLRRALFGQPAIYLILVVIAVFWFTRNL